MFKITYIMPFIVKNEISFSRRLSRAGWDEMISPFSNEEWYRISRYFGSEVTKLYGNAAKYYGYDDYKYFEIEFCEGQRIEIEACFLILLPGRVGQLVLRVSSTSPNPSIEFLQDVHAKLRVWSNSYAVAGDARGAHDLKFWDRRSGALKNFTPFEKCTDWRNSEFESSPLFDFLIDGATQITHRPDEGVSLACDRRAPALIYGQFPLENIERNTELYKVVAGDASTDPLPGLEYVEEFIRGRESSPYSGEKVCGANYSRSVVDSYGFLMLGARDNGFFREIVQSSYQSIYFVLFSVAWYQYSFLSESVRSIESMSSRGGDPHSKDVETMIKSIGANLKPSLLSFCSREEQAIIFMSKIQDTLGTKILYEMLDRQTSYWHSYAVTVETRATANAAIIIGMISILGLVCTILFGLAQIKGDGAERFSSMDGLATPLFMISLAGLFGSVLLGIFSNVNPRGAISSISVKYIIPYIVILFLFILSIFASIYI